MSTKMRPWCRCIFALSLIGCGGDAAESGVESEAEAESEGEAESESEAEAESGGPCPSSPDADGTRCATPADAVCCFAGDDGYPACSCDEGLWRCGHIDCWCNNELPEGCCEISGWCDYYCDESGACGEPPPCGCDASESEAESESEGKCPDGTCGPGEGCTNCPQDCLGCGCCGDGICDEGIEASEFCPSDCAASCGDGACVGEACGSCPADCGYCPPECGDELCTPGETCWTCPGDCNCDCGDGACPPGEDWVSCSEDCGVC